MLKALFITLLTCLVSLSGFAETPALEQEEAPAEPEAQAPITSPDQMDYLSLNGFDLGGAEYWINLEERPFSYPDDVQWGFVPGDDVPQSAYACAVKAYNALNEFLQNPPADLIALKDAGATSSFYLWVNDYTQVQSQRRERPNRMWHWNGGEVKDYTQGFWKWESTVSKDGSCLIPETAQITQMLLQVRTVFPPAALQNPSLMQPASQPQPRFPRF